MSVALPLSGSAVRTESLPYLAAPNGGRIAVSATIYREWVSLASVRTATGQTAQEELGWPLEDFTLPSRTEVVYFERGAIILRPDGRAFAVYGTIYLHYRDLFDLKTGAGFNLGLPAGEEETIPGGRRQRFDGADIYWNAALNAAFEVHGAIRDKWMALGGASGFLGLPLSDERPIVNQGREVGRYNQFSGGTIFWSPGTGACEVHGAIRDAYIGTYNGAIGALGFPITDETGSVGGGKRYNNFQRGCIVWSADSGAVNAYTSLDVWVESINGSGSHTFFESAGLSSVWLYVRVHVTSNTGIDVQSHLPPQGGDYGQPSATPGRIYTVSPVRGDLALAVSLDGWDHCVSRSDVHLGTVHATFTVDNGFGVNVPQHLNDGDFHAVLDMRARGVDNPNDPNFRRDLFWGFNNFDTPVLTHAQYAETFVDVESSESDMHWWNDLFYNQFYKTIAAGGNCYGMTLESIYAENNSSLFSEPIYPIAQAAALDTINKKHGYQLGAAYLDWYVANFLALRFWDPIRVFHDSQAAWNVRDYPMICLTNSSLSAGHCVRPCGPNAYQDAGAQYVIEVANPNAPGTDDANVANRIIIDKATNTYRFDIGGGEVWTGGKLSGGVMSWVPFCVVNREPRTPFWEALSLALGAGLLILGAGAGSSQITDDSGRTLYKPESRGRATRWDELNMSESAIPGLARVPIFAQLLSRGPLIARAGLQTLGSGAAPELYRIVGLPSPYGTAPTQAAFSPILAADAIAATARAFPGTAGTAAAAHPVSSVLGGGAATPSATSLTGARAAGTSLDGRWLAPVKQLKHQVSAQSSASYVWAFHTYSASAIAEISGSTGGDDVLEIANVGTCEQQVTVRTLAAAGARTAQVTLRSRVPQAAHAAVFVVENVGVAPGASFAANIQADGQTLQVQNGGPDATVHITMHSNGAASPTKSLAVPAGKTAVVAPKDWAALPSTPVTAKILSGPGGSIESNILL